ncbi:MAG TPA: ribbon-helix-helix domain-containing protein [Anaeromyxobacter sp.]|nr:ribbon-helix-helix domain-containing protein [Anaeromyxobacter sp.]
MHPFEISNPEAIPAVSHTRLEPMLVRLPPALATELRNLARRTRVRQSDYLREAVADLLAKYAGAGSEGPQGGSAM